MSSQSSLNLIKEKGLIILTTWFIYYYAWAKPRRTKGSCKGIAILNRARGQARIKASPCGGEDRGFESHGARDHVGAYIALHSHEMRAPRDGGSADRVLRCDKVSCY